MSSNRGRPRKNRPLYAIKDWVEYTSDSDSDCNNIHQNLEHVQPQLPEVQQASNSRHSLPEVQQASTSRNSLPEVQLEENSSTDSDASYQGRNDDDEHPNEPLSDVTTDHEEQENDENMYSQASNFPTDNEEQGPNFPINEDNDEFDLRDDDNDQEVEDYDTILNKLRYDN